MLRTLFRGLGHSRLVGRDELIADVFESATRTLTPEDFVGHFHEDWRQYMEPVAQPTGFLAYTARLARTMLMLPVEASIREELVRAVKQSAASSKAFTAASASILCDAFTKMPFDGTEAAIVKRLYEFAESRAFEFASDQFHTFEARFKLLMVEKAKAAIKFHVLNWALLAPDEALKARLMFESRRRKAPPNNITLSHGRLTATFPVPLPDRLCRIKLIGMDPNYAGDLHEEVVFKDLRYCDAAILSMPVPQPRKLTLVGKAPQRGRALPGRKADSEAMELGAAVRALTSSTKLVDPKELAPEESEYGRCDVERAKSFLNRLKPLGEYEWTFEGTVEEKTRALVSRIPQHAGIRLFETCLGREARIDVLMRERSWQEVDGLYQYMRRYAFHTELLKCMRGLAPADEGFDYLSVLEPEEAEELGVNGRSLALREQVLVFLHQHPGVKTLGVYVPQGEMLDAFLTMGCPLREPTDESEENQDELSTLQKAVLLSALTGNHCDSPELAKSVLFYKALLKPFSLQHIPLSSLAIKKGSSESPV